MNWIDASANENDFEYDLAPRMYHARCNNDQERLTGS